MSHLTTRSLTLLYITSILPACKYKTTCTPNLHTCRSESGNLQFQYVDSISYHIMSAPAKCEKKSYQWVVEIRLEYTLLTCTPRKQRNIDVSVPSSPSGSVPEHWYMFYNKSNESIQCISGVVFATTMRWWLLDTQKQTTSNCFDAGSQILDKLKSVLRLKIRWCWIW